MFRVIPPLLATLILVYLLNNSWVIGNNRIPPLGKFLDPVSGFWKNAEPDGYRGPENITLTNLEGEVHVTYDSLLIPHIFAATEADLYLVQGYVTATHRLWQMEFQIHASSGRLSSILGVGQDSAILKYDRKQRRLGIPVAAERALNEMMKDNRTALAVERCTQGVNQYIQSLTYANLPLEYKLMDYQPEPWTTLKCAYLLKSMCQTLNMGDKDIQMTNALALYGPEMVELLYPDNEPGVDPVVDNPGGWDFEPVTLDGVPPALPEELIRIAGLTSPNPNVGSNNWVVSGAKTASGAPILCNDPHLNTTLPSVWYAAQLNAPGVNVMGVGFPGAPGIIIGFNDSIAWGVTNAQRDLIDWYKITYEDASRSKYQLNGEWKPTEKRIEEIKIRGHESFYDTVVYTQWGPVVYDRNFGGKREPHDYAFRWISHDPSNELLTFYGLNRAKKYEDFMNALDHFKAPGQNFVFASVSGDIAVRIQGKYPVRRPLEGKFALDGSKSSNGWQAFIPDRQNVTMKNPERGFVSSANQYPADSTYPYYVTASDFEAYRNRRINNTLRSSASIKVEDMMLLQNDNYSIKAEESLPSMLTALDSLPLSPAEQEIVQQLKAWNYNNDKDAVEATYYDAWWNNIMRLTWDEVIKADVALQMPTSFNTIRLMKEQPDLKFFDVMETEARENARDVIRLAFRKTINDLEEWKRRRGNSIRWADYKDTYIQHLARLEPLGRHVQHGGNDECVNASARTYGPSWRMIVSLDKSGIKARATYPGGQSGNPGSKHYDDLLPAWSTGTYHELHFMKTTNDSATLYYSTIFTPDKP